MPRHLIDLGAGSAPLLDIASYARRGPARRDRLSPAQVEYVARTVRRAPEVMIKVLTQGAKDLKGVARHINYLTRKGELDIETDHARPLEGKDSAKDLLDDWDLALDELRPTAELSASGRYRPVKLVHKLIFSMPAGTPPQKVLAAVKDFAREEFGSQYRYAMVLHTDKPPHPHVHVIVKALGYDGKRLNIRKATLREWRKEFARHLRDHGVAANATTRAARGAIRVHKLDGIFRADKRKDSISTHLASRKSAVAEELERGVFSPGPGKERLLHTRRLVVRGWNEISDRLEAQGETELAQAARKFVADMAPPLTEKEQIRATLLEKAAARSQGRQR